MEIGCTMRNFSRLNHIVVLIELLFVVLLSSCTNQLSTSGVRRSLYVGEKDKKPIRRLTSSDILKQTDEGKSSVNSTSQVMWENKKDNGSKANVGFHNDEENKEYPGGRLKSKKRKLGRKDNSIRESISRKVNPENLNRLVQKKKDKIKIADDLRNKENLSQKGRVSGNVQDKIQGVSKNESDLEDNKDDSEGKVDLMGSGSGKNKLKDIRKKIVVKKSKSQESTSRNSLRGKKNNVNLDKVKKFISPKTHNRIDVTGNVDNSNTKRKYSNKEKDKRNSENDNSGELHSNISSSGNTFEFTGDENRKRNNPAKGISCVQKHKTKGQKDTTNTRLKKPWNRKINRKNKLHKLNSQGRIKIKHEHISLEDIPTIVPPPSPFKLPKGVVEPINISTEKRYGIVGAWEQIDDNNSADFLPGAYVQSKLIFYANRIVKIERVYLNSETKSVVTLSWLIDYVVNEEDGFIILGQKSRNYLDICAIKGLLRTGVEIALPDHTLPTRLDWKWISECKVNIAGKIYTRVKIKQ